jgi:hypothetical protein
MKNVLILVCYCLAMLFSILGFSYVYNDEYILSSMAWNLSTITLWLLIVLKRQTVTSCSKQIF